MAAMRLVPRLQMLVAPRGRRPRQIITGLNRGVKMYLDLRGASQIWVGLYEREIRKFFQLYAQQINMAIDVGASDGFYTLYFLTKTAARKVFAFEPS